MNSYSYLPASHAHDGWRMNFVRNVYDYEPDDDYAGMAHELESNDTDK